MRPNSEFTLKDYPLFAKGYGIASKYILCDPGLSVAAKGDYCYKRSLCGNAQESVFPGIFKIMEDLNISKKLYYKARGELLEAGIIIIKRQKQNGEFDKNTYEFPLQPARYMVAGDDAYIASVSNQIHQFGVMAKYGLCPHAVMADKETSIGAKVLFAYISAHINVTENPYAELDPDLIQYHLGMGIKTYQKYVRELKSKNLLSVQRIRRGGSFEQLNRYAINYAMAPASEDSIPVTVISFPNRNDAPKDKKEEAVESPKGKKEEAVEPPKDKKEEMVEPPKDKKEEMVEPPEDKKEETVEPPKDKKEETVEPPKDKKEETVEPSKDKKEETVESPKDKKGEMIKGETKKEETINTSLTNTSNNQIIYDGLIETVRKKIQYRVITFGAEEVPQLLNTADLLVEAIVEILTSTNHTTIINGQPYLTEYVREALMNVNNNAAMNVLNRCLAGADKIRNLKSYLLTSIFNEIQLPTQEPEDIYDFEEAF